MISANGGGWPKCNAATATLLRLAVFFSSNAFWSSSYVDKSSGGARTEFSDVMLGAAAVLAYRDCYMAIALSSLFSLALTLFLRLPQRRR